ncbi:MAG TPA: S9 family peptidase [Segeticoccus sp.]|uniref:S9 family peptidase n=1 Tax=Segeticoccus sp. TaxID=2706531 RepID=UPI002D80CAAC|nr:S9 family peptidase [Segeticoccus sp.]HET8599711.1 S9 family peptidase [Segeticoccus sp.]
MSTSTAQPTNQPHVPKPPVAKQVEHVREHHGDRVIDPYEWLRDKSDPEVIAHLEAENAYAQAMTEHLAPLRDQIFQEIKSRTQETDLSVPVLLDGWWYYSRTFEGKQYAAQCRVRAEEGVGRPVLSPSTQVPGEQVLLDGNVEAEGHEFFSLGAFEVSHDATRVAYAVDLQGDERFALKVKQIDTDTVIDEAVDNIGYGAVWSVDGRHLFYTRVDDAWRPFQVWRHEVGTPADSDVKVFEEPDERFWMGIGSSRDDRWLVIMLGSRTTSEALLLDLAEPLGAPRLVAPRRDGVEYDVEPAGDRLLITHNAGDVDFEVAHAPLDATSADQWQPLIPPVPGERILGVEAFADYVVVSLRRDGLSALRILPRDAGADSGFGAVRDVRFEEPLYTVGTGSNPQYDQTAVQVVFESMVTPRSVYDYDVTTGELTLLKQQEVLGGYDPADYVQRREWATAPDGTRVPISLVARADVRPDASNPGLIYGYGSYEISMDPYFSVARLSLLDRGFVYAVAHVRGGGEMGRRWYDDGKMEHKRNTFTDFVACADRLVESGWVAADRLVAEGGSAGGMLMGAVANLAPDRFRAIHAAVPFVDSLTTILDPSLPLTVGEWEEWGDPLHHADVYAYMKSYAPYENVAPRQYPAILATTSLNDTRVYFVEPAKWVARLREVTTNDPATRPILLKTEMVAGHGGKSGRYDAWQQHAFELAFLIDQAGAA